MPSGLGSEFGSGIGLPFGVESFRPGFLHVRSACDEFARLAIEHVVKTVSIREAQKLSRLPIDYVVEENRRFRRIPVVRFVRRELEKPFYLAGVGIDRQQRAGVKIVARPLVAVPVRRGIARAPIDKIQLGIVGPGIPRGAAGGHGIAPGFRARVRRAPERSRCATAACRLWRRSNRAVRERRLRCRRCRSEFSRQSREARP